MNIWVKILGGVLIGVVVGLFLGKYIWGRSEKIISEGVTSGGNYYQVIDTKSNDSLDVFTK